MSITVKICGLTRTQDVEDAIEAGADVLGFVFDRGPCNLTLAQAPPLLAVGGQAGRPCLRIAVVGDLPCEQIVRIAALGFDAVQAVEPAYEAAASCGAAFVVPAFFDDTTMAARVRSFRRQHAPRFDQRNGLLQGCINVDGGGGGGTGNRADWQVAAALAREGPLMLAGGLTAENVSRAIALVQPDAVDVSSGVEAAPGIKDRAQLRAFVAAAKGC